MTQPERMNSASDVWEADPWDAPDELVKFQLAGFRKRAGQPIVWTPVRGGETNIFGIDVAKLIGADVELFATHDGEDMLLMQSAWHGFPDPPEWRLATRSHNNHDTGWVSWGYFAKPPEKWNMPEI